MLKVVKKISRDLFGQKLKPTKIKKSKKVYSRKKEKINGHK